MKAAKKAFAVIICLVLSLACGSGQKDTVNTEGKRVLANRFTEIPCYALKENATVEEMRAMAVKAFRDQLTVPWYVSENVSYRKIGPGGEDIFRVKASQNYGGLPYSNGDTGLLHWLQFYDFSTGEISIGENDMARNYGNTCSSGLMWGISAVSAAAASSGCSAYVPRNGFYPVGDYDTDYHSLNTENICTRNGKQTMFKAYAEIKPADVCAQNVPGEDKDEHYPCHVIMAVESAHVEYNADGSIDGARSYICYQDQHMGILRRTPPFYMRENGTIMHYSGHRSSKYPFNSLYADRYVPVTAAEFCGKATYQKAFAKTDKKDIKTYADISADTLRSNYNIITVTAEFYKNKKAVASEKLITGTSDFKNGRIGSVKLSRIFSRDTLKNKLKSGETYTLKLYTLVGTGETIEVLNTEIKI